MHNSKTFFNKGLLKNWNTGMLTQTQLTQIKFVAKMDNVKTLQSILKAIAFSDSAVFQLSDHGMKVIVEESKTVQAAAYIQKSDQSFSEYRYKATDEDSVTSFSINLKVLVENTFSDDCTSLKILYKGQGAPLVLILENEQVNLITECSIKTREVESLLDLDIEDEDTVCQIVFKSFEFYNFLNDMFKTTPKTDEIELYITPSSPYFRMLAKGATDSEADFSIEKESEIIMHYNCKERVCFQYKSANIKLLLKALQIATTTTLSMDKRGLLGVRTMIEDERKIQSFVEFFIVPLQQID